jgi:outer membrane autotransporter protein
MQAIPGSALPTPPVRKQPRLRASARAIRAALLASSALALGGALPAWAGDCVLSGSTMACNGSFETPSPDPALAFVGDDLTVVLGDEAPSSVLATGVDGISVLAPTGTASLYNYADIAAVGGGGAEAIEVDAYGDIALGNYGSASAQIGPGGGAPYYATAVDLYSYAGSVFAENAAGGSITATAEADYGYTFARGVVAMGDNAYVDNAGSIVVSGSADIGNVVAIGVQEAGTFATLYNELDASILVSAESGQGINYGADAFSVGAFIVGVSAYVYNAGSIAAESVVHGGEGISTAIGTQTYAFYGFATTTNYGSISAHAVDDSDEASYSFAYGVVNKTHYLQAVASTANYGDISAQAETYFGAAIAYGVQNAALYSATDNAEGATISAVAEVEYSGRADAVGVENYGKYYAHDSNAGTITAYASSAYTEHYGSFTYGAANAIGVIEDARYFGGTVMENSGEITAVALSRGAADFFQGGASATGIYQNGKYYTGVVNSGDIAAYADTEIGIAVAFGIQARSKYGATTYVYNAEGASIVAEAHSGSAAGDTYAGLALANAVRMFGGSFAQLYNDGVIVAIASVDAGDRDYLDDSGDALAYGSYQRGQYGATLRNTGDILAQAEAAYSHASAYGAWLRGYYYAVSYNEGDIVANALADGGDAFAVGNYLDAPGQHFCTSYGYYGCYTYADYGGLVALENDGRIQSYAGADDGIASAYGAVLISVFHAQAANRGDIQAVASAEAGSAQAVGLLLRADQGDAWLDNAEGASIVAAAYGDDARATAVLFATYGYAAVANSGAIVALGDGERIAIDARYSAGVAIDNYGLVSGSIFGGAGDDAIYNHEGALLRLTDSTIDLGSHGAYGNQFLNWGTISVDGSNAIDMGSGPYTLVPSLNPYAFQNYGLIDFQDGDADDTLVITGDFGGDGDIDVDASGRDASSDLLFIDGSVMPGTVATINVNLLDLPADGSALSPVVLVTGDSDASNFVLGETAFDAANSFLSVDLALVAQIDASNASPDEFALSIEVTGLSDPGTLAASVAPAALGLAQAQVGTWRQRMGVIDASRRDAVSLWARTFQDKGDVSPTHEASAFGPGGHFDWRQANSGFEAGMDFGVTGQVSLGLLFSKSQADTHLRSPGSGKADYDATTWGLYATWISPQGWYLDASWRWMAFDAELSSSAGRMETSGDARTFNAETGRAWTLAGGLVLEPQLQYTRSHVEGIDALASASGMFFRGQGGDASRGRIGLSLRQAFGDAVTGWQWTPEATLSAVREFDGESAFLVDDAFAGRTSIAGSSVLLQLGATARHGNWSLNGGVNWQDGGAIDSAFGGQLSLRYTFGPSR